MCHLNISYYFNIICITTTLALRYWLVLTPYHHQNSICITTIDIEYQIKMHPK